MIFHHLAGLLSSVCYVNSEQLVSTPLKSHRSFFSPHYPAISLNCLSHGHKATGAHFLLTSQVSVICRICSRPSNSVSLMFRFDLKWKFLLVFSVGSIQVSCYSILNSLYTLGTTSSLYMEE